MSNGEIVITGDDVVKMVLYLQEDLGLILPDKRKGYHINLNRICEKFSNCAEAYDYVVCTIKNPKAYNELSFPFRACVAYSIKDFGWSGEEYVEVCKALHSTAIAVAVLLLAQINPSKFIEGIDKMAFEEVAVGRACAVRNAILSYALTHDIPLNGQNNYQACCEDCA